MSGFRTRAPSQLIERPRLGRCSQAARRPGRDQPARAAQELGQPATRTERCEDCPASTLILAFATASGPSSPTGPSLRGATDGRAIRNLD